MRLPSGGNFWFRVDLLAHQVVLETDQESVRTFSMPDALPATAFGDQVLEAVKEIGLSGTYERDRFENDEPRQYHPDAAERFFIALSNADRIFKKHRENLEGEKSPVQFWPHGFDLSFEWFGTRSIEYEEGGEMKRLPSQLNLGFAPGDATNPQPYFYSNPWPFETEALIHQPLPQGTRWFTGSWKGSILPYRELVGDKNAEERLLDYARAVFEITKPTLLASHILLQPLQALKLAPVQGSHLQSTLR
jgi:hypothetical protein